MASRLVPRILFHVDMDAFYAAVEIRENPELEGKPVVVGADPRKHPRGVVLTASYEARKFGVRSAMSCVQAVRLCPDAVFVPPHFELYGRVSSEIMELLRGFADHLQPTGIEEGYLDVTTRCGGDYNRARELALDVKAAVRKEQRLLLRRHRPDEGSREDRLRFREARWAHRRPAGPHRGIPHSVLRPEDPGRRSQDRRSVQGDRPGDDRRCTAIQSSGSRGAVRCVR